MLAAQAGLQNGLQNSAPHANMQAAHGIRLQGVPIAAAERPSIEDLKTRREMVLKAIEDWDAYKCSLVAASGTEPQATVDVNTLTMKIAELRHLLGRIEQWIQIAGMTAQNTMQGPPGMSNM